MNHAMVLVFQYELDQSIQWHLLIPFNCEDTEQLFQSNSCITTRRIRKWH